MQKIISALALSLVAATAAQAQAVRTEKNMSLELANQIALGNLTVEVKRISDKDKLGKPLWERLGYTSDPGKAIDIVATGNTAGDAAGSICLRATYYIK